MTLQALQQRIRQQEILSELGVRALKGSSIDQLLSDTVSLAAEGLQAEFCKILEYLPSENTLLVRTGIGWGPGVVGIATVGADLESPAGYALRSGNPVISNHLENEERFRTPALLASNNILRAMNVILQGDGRPFGVLEVDSKDGSDFTEHDVAFLQGAANIAGMGIERDRYQRNLQAAVQHQEVLLKEVNHRVKNSLSIVASMLRLQAREIGNQALTDHLEEAVNRVQAIARAHESLYQSENIEWLDFGVYITQVCGDLGEAIGRCTIQIEAPKGILIDTDRSIPLALSINELITNAAKYAYPGDQGGKITVRVLQHDNGTIVASVGDEGVGLPDDFDVGKAKGLGMRMIRAFAQQLGAKVSMVKRAVGTEFVITLPPKAQ